MIEEIIPDGLKEKHLKHYNELQKMLPKGYFVTKGKTGWPIDYKRWFFSFSPLCGWVWWHSMEIECNDGKIYDVLKKFGNKNKFKLIRKNFLEQR